MELLRNEHLRKLLEPTTGPCASIFLPTHRGGVEIKQGPIRLKNQIKNVETELGRHALRASDMKAFLEPMFRLCENSGFWQYQSDGLSIFRSPEKFFYYRLPLQFEELVVVTDRFHVKPLLRLFTEDGSYYVLSLSQKGIQLLQCTRYGVREIDLPAGTPRSITEFQEEAGVQKQLQVHTAGAASKFHGHGARSQDSKQDLRDFFRAVDKGVRGTLKEDRAPLVLAGVEYLFPLYHEVNTYANLLENGVPGNPEGRRPEELQSAGWAAVEPYFRQRRLEASRRYEDLMGGERATSDIRRVVAAAEQGRVEQLFVAVGKQIWGKFDHDAQETALSEVKEVGDRDLLNLAATQALLHGGSVYAVPPDEVPGGKLLAAILRY